MYQGMISDQTEGGRLIRRYDRLEQKRQLGWEEHWKDIQEFILPRKGFFPSQGDQPNDGRQNYSEIIDGTATRAANLTKAAFQGGMTSPSRHWFTLAFRNTELNENHAAKTWLKECEKRLYAALRRSNFYGEMDSVYEELVVFGSGAIMCEPDPDTSLLFRGLTIGTYCMEQNDRGLVDTIYRYETPTALNLKTKFKKELPPDIESQYRNNPDQYCAIIHGVFPNTKYSPEKIGFDNRPWTSAYVNYKGNHDIIHKHGYMEQPFSAFRWGVRGHDVYGISPCMDILGDVRMLQQLQHDSLLAIQKVNNPPVNVPEGAPYDPLDYPGALNPYATGDPADIRPTYQINPDIVAIENKIAQVQGAIREGLFNNLFLSIVETPQMTATEVMQRQEEKLLVLGPVVERVEQGLDLLISRSFHVLERTGDLPVPPPVVAESGARIRIEYTSMMSQAQKLIGANAIIAARDFVAGMATINPFIVDLYDSDEAVREYFDIIGVSPKQVKDRETVEFVRQQREAAQMQQQQMIQQQQAVESTKALSQTSLEGPNALTALMEQTGV